MRPSPDPRSGWRDLPSRSNHPPTLAARGPARAAWKETQGCQERGLTGQLDSGGIIHLQPPSLEARLPLKMALLFQQWL